MKFVNPHTHPISLVDGREVQALGEVDLTKEQYEHPEQWRLLPEYIAGSAAAAKLMAEAAEDPGKFDNRVEDLTPSNDGGTT